MNEISQRVIPGLSPQTRAIFERLMMDAIGQTTTYDELSALIGRDVQFNGKHHLDSARRKLLNAHARVHECVPNVGIKRLNDQEILDCGDSMIKSARRKVRKAAMKVTSVADFDALSNDDKIRHNVQLSIMGAMSHIGSDRQRKRITSKVAEAQRRLPVQKTLEAFGHKG